MGSPRNRIAAMMQAAMREGRSHRRRRRVGQSRSDPVNRQDENLGDAARPAAGISTPETDVAIRSAM
jgi:hypothetical protein